MKYGLLYDKSNGAVRGLLEVSAQDEETVFAANIAAYDQSRPSIGVLEISSGHAILSDNRLLWKVDLGTLEIEKKTELTITTDKPQIAADGTDEATISISPDTSIDVLVNGETVTLAAGETLALTSDVPMRFEISIDHIDFYADPIIVEAV